MKLMDVMTAPWAITPDVLREIRGIYETHMRGDKIDIAGVEARLGRPLKNETESYQVVNGVAVIPAHGAIAKRMNLFTQISGGVSTQILRDQVMEVMGRTDVSSIILDMDSPGGTVDGTFELADELFGLRGTKPLVAFANGLMASAAYAIGAATDAIYISGPTTTVGSIGVVATHVDVSGYEQKLGVKTTEIYAGKYKRIASQYEPLSDDGRADIQAQVDYLYSVFVERVAQFRNVPVSTVLDDMADGRLFIGQQAVTAGLVDGVSTLDGLIAMLAEGRGLPTGAGAASQGESRVVTIGATPRMTEELADELMQQIEQSIANHDQIFIHSEETNMPQEITKGYVAEHHPDIAEAFRQEGAAKAREEGAAAERQRIQDVYAQSMPGHDKLIDQLAFDGKTTGPEAAVQVLRAEREANGNGLRNIEKDAAELAKVPAAAAPKEEGGDAGLAHLPIEEQCKVKWEKSPNLRAEFGGNYDNYLAYEKAAANGQIRMLKNHKE